MRIPSPQNWSVENFTAPVTGDPTPAATVDLLVMADAYPVAVATTPYCGVGRIFDGCTTAERVTRYLGVILAPGAQHARGAFTRPSMGTGTDTGHDNTSSTGTGGTSTPNVIVTPDPNSAMDPATGGLTYVWGFGWSQLGVVVTGQTVDDTPAANQDRQYVLAAHGHPYVETVTFARTGSLAFWVSGQVANLELL